MGDPRRGTGTQAGAQQRAVRERQARLEQALEELQQIRKGSERTKEQARASQSDPLGRIMKPVRWGYAPS